jgi:hypothetical protein
MTDKFCTRTGNFHSYIILLSGRCVVNKGDFQKSIFKFWNGVNRHPGITCKSENASSVLLPNGVKQHGQHGLNGHDQRDAGHEPDMARFVADKPHCAVHKKRAAERGNQQQRRLRYAPAAGPGAELVKYRRDNRGNAYGGKIPREALLKNLFEIG